MSRNILTTCTVALWFATALAAHADSNEKNATTASQEAPAVHNADQALEIKLKAQREIEVDNALRRAQIEQQKIQVEQELAGLYIEIERLRLEREAMLLRWEVETATAKKEHDREMLVLQQQQEKLNAEIAVTQAKATQSAEASNQKIAQLDQHIKELTAKTKQLHTEIEHIQAVEARDMHIDSTPIYLKDPLKKDGTLVISDRCVTLNGVITPWKANYVVDRIQYFNNKDTTYPIFIVIESSPGGMLTAGWRILTAMKNSPSPVYVVVKSYAASMAACIATLATKSYAYPNAVILHHQPWVFNFGVTNVRAQKEAYEDLKRWWQRLGAPIAKKMGISLATLDKRFFEKSMRGDWEEFATEAQKIKWVDYVIAGIEEQGVKKMPQAEHYTWLQYIEEYYGMGSAIDVKAGKVYLPKLSAKDFYYLYDPENRYQVK